MIEKIIEISNKYIGKAPYEMDCTNWTELMEKQEIEIRESISNTSVFLTCYDGEVLAAFTNEERCNLESTESGAEMQATKLYFGKRV